MRRWTLALLAVAAPALAVPLTITKSVTMISDPLGSLVPRSVPGAIADYKTRADNPLGNVGRAVTDILMVENLPANVDLRVADLNPGKGPVEFSDGAVLGLGASGLVYGYTSLTAPADALEFSSGTGWTYQPVADADGYDHNVRAIRVKLTQNFATSTSFQLRYRVRIR
jgi:hypothetical protein